MFTCADCDAVFTTRRLFRRHRRTHLRFTCRRCTMTFSSAAELRSHVPSHFVTVATQTGMSEATQWGRTLTPTKARQRTFITAHEYQRCSLDPLGLLENSDDDASKDPRGKPPAVSHHLLVLVNYPDAPFQSHYLSQECVHSPHYIQTKTNFFLQTMHNTLLYKFMVPIIYSPITQKHFYHILIESNQESTRHLIIYYKSKLFITYDYKFFHY